MLMLTLISGLVIGASLGVLGAGGAILTVPALMYLVGMGEKTAIAHSVVMVGIIALTGTLMNWRRGHLPAGSVYWLFALASVPAAALGAVISTHIDSVWQLSLLITLMLVAAIKMLKPATPGALNRPSMLRLFIAGSGTGAVTGLAGVGGGFLMVPALVLYAGLSISQATATSLALIVLNTLSAGVTLYSLEQALQWQSSVLLAVSAFGIAGVLAGQRVSARLPAATLRRIFALGLLLLSVVLTIDLLDWPG